MGKTEWLSYEMKIEGFPNEPVPDTVHDLTLYSIGYF